MAKFTGFPDEGRAFLKGLEKNNKKEWFDKNRAGYDEGLLEPGKAFVEAVGAKLKAVEPAIHAIPKVNGSIFRINRDVRFSKDKRPYKTYFDMWFWVGDKKGWDTPGFFWRMTKDSVVVGVGMHAFQKEALARYRDAVGDDKKGAELVKLRKKLEKAGYEVGGAHYKRVPKPFEQDHPRAELLKHNALFVHLEGPPPAEVSSAKMATWTMGHFRKMAPLHVWLKDVLRG
jgi:uncharacterized protein (TIGR02453 family)